MELPVSWRRRRDDRAAIVEALRNGANDYVTKRRSDFASCTARLTSSSTEARQRTRSRRAQSTKSRGACSSDAPAVTSKRGRPRRGGAYTGHRRRAPPPRSASGCSMASASAAVRQRPRKRRDACEESLRSTLRSERACFVRGFATRCVVRWYALSASGVAARWSRVGTVENPERRRSSPAFRASSQRARSTADGATISPRAQ